MDIQSKIEGQVAQVSVKGSIDTLTSSSLADALSEHITSGCYRIVLDLAEVDYTSSAGLRVLLGIAKLTREKGGDLRLSSIQQNVLKVLSLSGFTSILKIFDTPDAAMQSFL